MAELTTMAFSKASLVIISEGFKSSETMSTILLPVAYAI